MQTVIWNNLEKRKHDQRQDTGRLKHARTDENVATADELVDPLSEEGQKVTPHSTRQISPGTDLTLRSIVHMCSVLV